MSEVKPELKKQNMLNILVIDDDREMRMIIRYTLQNKGYQIYEAEDGEKGIEGLIKLCVPDLVLVDAHMPNMGGIAFLKKIRELWNSSVLPVIAVTGDYSTDTIVAFYNAGANDFVRKPFDAGELCLRIEAQLQLARQNHAMNRFVPDEFLKLMGKQNVSDLAPGDQVKTEVSFLYNFIRNLNEVTKGIPAEERINFFNAYLKRVLPLIRACNGFVDKYENNCLMAIFPDDPGDALQASIEISKEIERYNLERKAEGYEEILTGSGIHTGDIYLGIVGDSQRISSTVVSEAANIAAKLEGFSRKFDVSSVLTEETLSKISGADPDSFRQLESVKMQGHREPFNIYEVLSCRNRDELKLIKSYQHIYSKGYKELSEGQFVRAMKHFAEILKLNPRDHVVSVHIEKMSKE